MALSLQTLEVVEQSGVGFLCNCRFSYFAEGFAVMVWVVDQDVSHHCGWSERLPGEGEFSLQVPFGQVADTTVS